MISLSLGIAGFLLYLLYDINSFTRQNPFIHKFFLLGTLLIGSATAYDLLLAFQLHAFSGAADIFLLVGAAACFAALIYCLFFALPFEATYTEQTNNRHVYDGGVYALCRHPGILCFFGMYLLLGAAALPGKLLIHGMVFSLLNLAYAWFQDRITFPRTFCDYEDYQKRIPFLIPTGESIRLARQTWPRANGEEDDT